MYKLILCWRYLRTRYLALACIVSIMLGVATLIVVNSVMNGFSTKLRDRLHMLLSDIVIEASGLEGFSDPKGKMAKIMSDPFLKEQIVAMSPTMEVFAMLQYVRPWDGERITRTVHVVGVDLESCKQLDGFQQHLVLAKENNTEPTFELTPLARKRFEDRERWLQQQHELQRLQAPIVPGEPPPPMAHIDPIHEFKIPRGAIVGHLLATIRYRDKDAPDNDPQKLREMRVLDYGAEIILTTVGGQKMAPVFDRFVVVDLFKSEMSEYDNNFVYVPLDYLQHLRTMEDRVTSIQIKVKDYNQHEEIVKKLNELFDPRQFHVSTWEDKQGPLLAAISIEKGLLNVLLFLIVAVAGFGILAIFSMIVSEKTRDIGILKALGASNGGVMKIFLGYGLLLGLVGAVLGTSIGVSLAHWINEVEQFLTHMTGQQVFNRETYYFDKIPTDTQVGTVILVNLGAIGIAVIFSVLPALKAAMLHPVQALRYE